MDGKIAIIEGKKYLLKEVKELVDEGKKKHWVPEEGEDYWYTVDSGEVSHTSIVDNLVDLGLYSKTKEEEEKKNKVREAIQRVKIYIGENFGLWEPTEEEWEDESFEKYTPCIVAGSICYKKSTLTKFHSPIGYLRTEGYFEQLIRDCKEDLNLIFK